MRKSLVSEFSPGGSWVYIENLHPPPGASRSAGTDDRRCFLSCFYLAHTVPAIITIVMVTGQNVVAHIHGQSAADC